MTEIEIQEQHSRMVAVLCKPDAQMQLELIPGDMHLIHMILGICGEGGELLDTVKKHVIYRKALDLENLVEELGDMEFFLEGLRKKLGITRRETLEHNLNKLAKRYEGYQYSDKAAINRADKQ